MENKSIINFCAGPSKLPIEVLKTVQEELISHRNIGYSILEMSHRSAEFSKIINETEILLREILDIPDNYKILFLQGGATAQFSAIPLNLINRTEKRKADYVVTGIWSNKAAIEARKYGIIREVFPKIKSFTDVPDRNSWNLDPEASYIYYCANETINGIEFHNALDTLPNIPVVCDMSSNILSRQIPISKFGLIFASAQKNIGCAGLTIVIIRDDLLNYTSSYTPTVLNYKIQNGLNSLYNTPPTFAIYIASQMLQWLKNQGGLVKISEINQMKSELLYNYIDSSDGFYNCPVSINYRSSVNVVFRISNCDEDLENDLVNFAKSRYNIIEIKGHRAVGGMRISLYNSIPLKFVEILINCLSDFRNLNKHYIKDL